MSAISLYVQEITDFYDDSLVRAWNDITSSSRSHPQMTRNWVEPWWRLRRGKLDFFSVVVKRSCDNEIVAVAPFGLEKIFKKFYRLKSFPTHYGDFYEALCLDGYEFANSIIIDHLTKNSKFLTIDLFNVPQNSDFAQCLSAGGFRAISTNIVHQADLSLSSYDDFLMTLSRNRRQFVKKKIRQLRRQGSLKLVKTQNVDTYLAMQPAMTQIFESRWGRREGDGDYNTFYTCRAESLKPLMDEGKAALYMLFLDEDLISYRIGFLQDNVFYDWKSCNDVKLERSSVGYVMTSMLIENLMADGISTLNFMAGDYPYKESFSRKDLVCFNRRFVFSRNKLLFITLIFFQKKLVPVLKALLNR